MIESLNRPHSLKERAAYLRWKRKNRDQIRPYCRDVPPEFPRPNSATQRKEYKRWIKAYPHLAPGHAANQIDVTGKKFGRVLAIKSLEERNTDQAVLWLLKCDCGKSFKAAAKHLTSGHIMSCGCLKREALHLKALNYSHPRHHCAKGWRLRDDRNRIWEFRNVRHFVNTHENLFDPTDIAKVIRANGKISCLAYEGLRCLHISRKKPQGTWKGWTWFSQVERIRNDSNDLLDRMEMTHG